MERLTRWYVRLCERLHEAKGQDAVEYALVMAGVSLAAYAAYQLMGTTIANFVSGVDAILAAAV
jgi:Flp pilus assembly pilin Flp